MLPYGRQTIEEDDIAAVTKVLRGAYLTSGPAVGAFEAKLCEVTQAAEAVVCANGTAALHLAAMALDLGPGDVAIVPAQTFVATANAVAMTGARVAFADVDPDTGLMRAQDLDAALAAARPLGRVRALFVVHLNGQTAPMAELAAIARAAGLAVVEDSCHAIGGLMPGADGPPTPVGSCAWSDMATFSFHPVKTVTMGEGGAVTTNDAAMAQRLRDLRGHGMVREAERFQDHEAAFDAGGQANPWYYEMQALGYNYRASDLQCALGLSQLGKLERFVARRAELVAAYDAALGTDDPLVRPIARVEMPAPGWHLYPVLIDFAALAISRAAVMRSLAAQGVGTQVHYIPVPHQPYWRGAAMASACPGARAYGARALSLPLFPAMTEADVARVVTALREAVVAPGRCVA